MTKEFVTLSAEETTIMGRRIGEVLPKGSVVCFFGDLATGKTTLIKGIVEGATGLNEQVVTSPTFVYLNIYEGNTTVYHFDLYRFDDVDQFLSMGFDEYLSGDGICCVEWAERIESVLPASTLFVTMEHRGEGRRYVQLNGFDHYV